VPYAVNHAMVQVAFQYDLTGFMERGFCRSDLNKNVFTGFVALYHFYQPAYLPFDPLQAFYDSVFVNMSIHFFSIPPLRNGTNLSLKTIYDFVFRTASSGLRLYYIPL